MNSKTVINNDIIEKVNSSNYLGYNSRMTNNREIEIKLKRFNQIYGIIRRTLNNKMRKDAQIKFYKPLEVPMLMYGSKIWTIFRRQKKQIVTAEIKFLRSVAGYSRENQIRNTKIREELNISNLNYKILRSR
jgi:hypothetical protein